MSSPASITQVSHDKISKPAAKANRKLPLNRIKKIAKMDEDVYAISGAALNMIGNATEKFAAYFAEQSFFYTLADKKKSLNYKHCAAAVARLPALDFLADVVPPTVRIADTDHFKNLAAQKRKEDAGKSTAIPEWARAHPEALAKMQAAEAEEAAAAAAAAEAAMQAPATPEQLQNGTQSHDTNGHIEENYFRRDTTNTRSRH